MYVTYVLWLFPFPPDNHLATIHPYIISKDSSCAKTVNIRERIIKGMSNTNRYLEGIG